MAQIVVVGVMVLAAMYKARQQKNLKLEEEIGLREAAGRAKASSQREAAAERRLKEHMHSRALAVAASSGAGVDDAGMVNLLGDLNAEGDYRIMSRLWAGEDAADGLSFRADQASREGDSALKAGYASAISSIASAWGGGAFGGGGTTPAPVTSLGAGTGSSLATIPRPAGFEADRWGF